MYQSTRPLLDQDAALGRGIDFLGLHHASHIFGKPRKDPAQKLIHEVLCQLRQRQQGASIYRIP